MSESFETPQPSDNKAKSEYNAVLCGKESLNFSKDDWESFLEKNLKDFSGNRKNAAKLLDEWTKGMRYVRNKLSEKGLKMKDPRICLIDAGGNLPYSIGYTSGLVFVKISFLEEYSKLDMSAIYTVTRADGEDAYEGTIPNLFRLAGIEEFYHGVYEQYKGEQQGDDPLKKSIAEYDAADHELRALKWELRHALEEGMDPITIKNLENRIENAYKVRKK